MINSFWQGQSFAICAGIAVIMLLAFRLDGATAEKNESFKDISSKLGVPPDHFVTGIRKYQGSYFVSSRPRNQGLGKGMIRNRQDGETIFQIKLGPGTALARKHGHHSNPKLAAVVKSKLIINLDSSQNFPESTVGGQTTRNVITYSPERSKIKNLTSNYTSEDRMVEALRWFPKQQILLCEQSKVAKSKLVIAKEGSGQALCLTLDGKRRKIGIYPEIKNWYEKYSSIRSGWAEGEDNRPAVRFEGRIVAFGDQRHGVPRYYVLDGNRILIGNIGVGAFVVNLASPAQKPIPAVGAFGVDPVAIDYDDRKIFLKTIDGSANGAQYFECSFIDLLGRTGEKN